ncbi:hypothetical protein C8R47DRAFT_1082740 [Mycena vitilis]|nr:hypothetical protein C8R47DRAFT_1082740 [Mycena vitilis]
MPLSLWFFSNPREKASSTHPGGTSCTVIIDRTRGPTESGVPVSTSQAPVNVPVSTSQAPVNGRAASTSLTSTRTIQQPIAPLEPVSTSASPSQDDQFLVRKRERSSTPSTFPEPGGPFEPSTSLAMSANLQKPVAVRRKSSRFQMQNPSCEPQSSQLKTSINATSQKRVHFTSESPTKAAQTKGKIPLTEKDTSSIDPATISSPFAEPLVYKLRRTEYKMVWYESNELTIAKPPDPPKDSLVRAGHIFLDTQSKNIWIRAEDNEIWESIEAGETRIIAGKVWYMSMFTGKPRWVASYNMK